MEQVPEPEQMIINTIEMQRLEDIIVDKFSTPEWQDCSRAPCDFALLGHFRVLQEKGSQHVRPEDMGTVYWAVHRLCELGASQSLMQYDQVARYLSTAGLENHKLRLFRLLCHHFFKTWPRPHEPCLVCDLPLLNFLRETSSTQMREGLCSEFEPYVEQQKIARALRFFQEQQLEIQGQLPSEDFQKTRDSICADHYFMMRSWQDDFLGELEMLLETFRKVPTLQQLASLVILRRLNGDRDETAGLDLTEPAMNILKPPPLHSEPLTPGDFNPFRLCQPMDGRSEDSVLTLKVTLVLPEVYKRLKRMGLEKNREKRAWCCVV